MKPDQSDQDKPKYRLSDLDVFEVSFVPKAANRKEFLMYKSADGNIDQDQDDLLDVEVVKSEDFLGGCDNCGYGDPTVIAKDSQDRCLFCGVTYNG